MKKYPIGFNTRINKESEENAPMEVCKGVIEPKKSVVQVYFPHRGMGWAYYNDSFDLKVGDFVYVEGKLESREYEKDGVKRKVHEVVVSEIQLLTPKGDSSSNAQPTQSAPVQPQAEAQDGSDLPF